MPTLQSPQSPQPTPTSTEPTAGSDDSEPDVGRTSQDLPETSTEDRFFNDLIGVPRRTQASFARFGITRKYTALHALAVWFKFYAWLCLVSSIIGAVLLAVFSVNSLANSTENPGSPSNRLAVLGLSSAAGILLAGTLQFIMLMAATEFLKLAMDVEENTRRTREALERLHFRS